MTLSSSRTARIEELLEAWCDSLYPDDILQAERTGHQLARWAKDSFERFEEKSENSGGQEGTVATRTSMRDG